MVGGRRGGPRLSRDRGAINAWESLSSSHSQGRCRPLAGSPPVPRVGSSPRPSSRPLSSPACSLGMCVLAKLYRSWAFRKGSRHAAPAGRACISICSCTGSMRFGSPEPPVSRGYSGRVPCPRSAGAFASPSPRWPWHLAHSAAYVVAPDDAWSCARARSAAVAPIWLTAHPSQANPPSMNAPPTTEATG